MNLKARYVQMLHRQRRLAARLREARYLQVGIVSLLDDYARRRLAKRESMTAARGFALTLNKEPLDHGN